MGSGGNSGGAGPVMGRVSVRRGLEVRYLARHVERLEVVVKELEGRPFLRRRVPALEHEAVDAVGQRVVHGFRHPVAVVDLLDHLAAVHTWVGWKREKRSVFFFSREAMVEFFRGGVVH